jgi:succinate dehydrogenase/fumarate reductase flavoprotein subunit
MEEINLGNLKILKYDSIIIGSGAAGLNCALHINENIPSSKIAIVTELLGGGTSFNTGSDKQTYYKLSIIGDQQDSPFDMAKDLCAGGAMHGDIALIEASNSIQEFFHLIHLGIPFPHDKYGGYVGFKTDNDPRQRATSIGPFTSQEMCKSLLQEVINRGISIFDKHYAVQILVDNSKEISEAVGLITLETDNLASEIDMKNLIDSLNIFQTKNIIIATGGPATLYKNSVYPKSQRGSMGLAIVAGCKFQNLTESQFGLASVKPRWNVSGSYQQVIPRYFSIGQNGIENEFLNNYFPSFQQLSKATFLKGYQWPFNSERIINSGSSLIDLAVYNETEILGNKVYLDYTKNPEGYNEDTLDLIAIEYLKNLNALDTTPIERLARLNPMAIDLFKNIKIDLYTMPLQIKLCNQHLNGGIKGDIWWETNINRLFAIGESNGSHGVHRPGGSALNSGQVGGLRAAQKIGKDFLKSKFLDKNVFLEITKREIKNLTNNFSVLLSEDSLNKEEKFPPSQILNQIRIRTSKFGGIVRTLENLFEEGKNLIKQLYNLNSIMLIKNNLEILDYLRIKDALITQQFILESILDYHEQKGRSRGSYLIHRDTLESSLNERYIVPHGDLNQFKFITSDNNLRNKIQTIQSHAGIIKIDWEKVREIPDKFSWFENVWKDFSEGKTFL